MKLVDEGSLWLIPEACVESIQPCCMKNRGIYAQIFFCTALVYLDVSESFCIVLLKNITSKKNLF